MNCATTNAANLKNNVNVFLDFTIILKFTILTPFGKTYITLEGKRLTLEPPGARSKMVLENSELVSLRQLNTYLSAFLSCFSACSIDFLRC